jgi:hypothetical protein
VSAPETSEILLKVPARSPYARVVRVAAAALALRHGHGFGEIDDLRLVIDETMIALLESESDDAEIVVVFAVDNDEIELTASRSDGHAMSADACHRFDAMASGLVDEHSITDATELKVRKIPQR